jgi:exodeoxyribonuclease VIII
MRRAVIADVPDAEPPPGRRHVVVDLETLGQRAGSIVCAIGAVWFEEEEAIEPGLHGAAFYSRVDAQSCVEAGLKADVPTVLWWMKQGEEARSELTGEGAPLALALAGLCAWWPAGDPQVWGFGADFDLVLLQAAFAAARMAAPWGFRQNRCLRTLAAMFPQVPRPERKPGEPAHHALYDARREAEHLKGILQKIQDGKTPAAALRAMADKHDTRGTGSLRNAEPSNGHPNTQGEAQPPTKRP